ncbi:TetR/AcrR family transcriptional regulator [Populibacterium corticicola]|uniref:TetR/AcrR family transcriptional regulator n=1 Tax=Populibacterium corticicola TaxID=1812826 RepID=A0ABW5XFN4_9MICO
MPRLIDHAQREKDIGDAALRVLAQDGLTALSVRRVAEEADLATASLRRAFPTQEALRQFCLERIHRDVATRIGTLTGQGVTLALSMLCELLPLDNVRRTELIVQLQLGSLALTDPSLVKNVHELHSGVRSVCAAALEAIRFTRPHTRTDASIEVERLHGLLDGLALHALWDASQETNTRVVATLNHHLRSLDTQESSRT